MEIKISETRRTETKNKRKQGKSSAVEISMKSVWKVPDVYGE